MTKHQHQRLKWLILIAIILIGGVIFIFSALQQSMMYFMTPTEIVSTNPQKMVRLGGMVAIGSIGKDPKTMNVKFKVTDFNQTINVSYTGITPDLFKENQGVVADGKWDGTIFRAEKLLAKHDENYMPIQVTNRLKK